MMTHWKREQTVPIRKTLAKTKRIAQLLHYGLKNNAIFMPVVVAGGAVRDAYLNKEPKDIDIFILNSIDKNNKIRIDYADILGVFNSLGGIRNKLVISSGSANPSILDYGDGFFIIANMLWPEVFGRVPIQIICRKEQHELELINSFDWNICQLACDIDGNVIYSSEIADMVKHNGWQSLNLSLNKNTKLDAKSSLKRGFKFEERYGLNISTTDLEYLCFEIIDGTTEVPKKMDIEELSKELDSKPKKHQTKNIVGFEKIAGVHTNSNAIFKIGATIQRP